MAAGTRLSGLRPEPSTRRSPSVGTWSSWSAFVVPTWTASNERPAPSAIATCRARTSASVSSEWVSSVPTSSATVADRTVPSVRAPADGVTDVVSTRTSGPSSAAKDVAARATAPELRSEYASVGSSRSPSTMSAVMFETLPLVRALSVQLGCHAGPSNRSVSTRTTSIGAGCAARTWRARSSRCAAPG